MMAEAKVKNVDEVSAEGFNEVMLAFPVANQQGIVTHWRRQPVSKELYEQQMDLDDEDRNPEFRTGAFKQASSLKDADFRQPGREPYVPVQSADQKRIAELEN